MKLKSFIPYEASTKSPAHIESAIINLIILNQDKYCNPHL